MAFYCSMKVPFSQMKHKHKRQYCHFSAHVTFHSILNQSTHVSISPWLQGDESCDWSAFPTGNERASLRGLFKQPVTRLRSCSRTAFSRDDPTCVAYPTDVSHSSLPGPHHGGALCMQLYACAKKHWCNCHTLACNNVFSVLLWCEKMSSTTLLKTLRWR